MLRKALGREQALFFAVFTLSPRGRGLTSAWLCPDPQPGPLAWGSVPSLPSRTSFHFAGWGSGPLTFTEGVVGYHHLLSPGA